MKLPGGSSLENLFNSASSPALMAGKDQFFEGPVNPDEYMVGPGDQLMIYFWSPAFNAYPCFISAEGMIAIPMVGSFSVANMTLTETKAQIEKEVAKALRIGRVTITLIEPRQFRVHVTGQVQFPGTYVVSATSRVSDAVEMAGGLKRERTNAAFTDTATISTASERKIQLIDRDGNAYGHADLMLFRRGGKTQSNPMLRDGATVFAGYSSRGEDRIGVFGAVNAGGLFEFVEGDKISDALILAGGLSANADSAKVSVVSANGQKHSSLSLKGSLAEHSLSYSLSSGDRIYIEGKPDTSRAGSVTLKGQIASPGGYPIRNGETSLKEVLEQAGGLLPTAAKNSARLIRKAPDNFKNVERERLLATVLPNPLAQSTPFDMVLAGELSKWEYGIVVLDLSENSKDKSAENVKLQDGDVLEIPTLPVGVRIIGGVNNGGEVAWEEGLKLNDYLKKAGGLNRGGWKNRAVVVKAKNGSQIRYQTSLPIDPGDLIFIPSKPITTSWDQFKDIVAVVAQVATLVLVVQNVGK